MYPMISDLNLTDLCFSIEGIAYGKDNGTEEDKHTYIQGIANEPSNKDDGSTCHGKNRANHSPEDSFDSAFFSHLQDFHIQDEIACIAKDNGDLAHITTLKNIQFLGEVVKKKPYHADEIANDKGWH